VFIDIHLEKMVIFVDLTIIYIFKK